MSLAVALQATPSTGEQRAAIVQALRAEGITVEAVCGAGDPVPTALTIAHRFVRHGYRLTFRLIEPHWVLIAMYERLIDAPTLRDPFTAMTWFVDWLRRRELGIDYVLGRVETQPYRASRDLDDNRLLRYYLRWGGAEVIPAAAVPGLSRARQMAATWQGIRYVKVGVADFRLPKVRARAGRRATSGSAHG